MRTTYLISRLPLAAIVSTLALCCVALNVAAADISIEDLRVKANNGDSAAQLYLGLVYDEGIVAPQDYKEAMKWYQMAADQGLAPAQGPILASEPG